MFNDLLNALATLPAWVSGLATIFGFFGGIWGTVKVLLWCKGLILRWLPHVSAIVAKWEASQLVRAMRSYHWAIANDTLVCLVGIRILRAFSIGSAVAIFPWVFFGQNDWVDHLVMLDRLHSPTFVYAFISVMLFSFVLGKQIDLLFDYLYPQGHRRNLMGQLLTLLQSSGMKSQAERSKWMTSRSIIPAYGKEYEEAERLLEANTPRIPRQPAE